MARPSLLPRKASLEEALEATVWSGLAQIVANLEPARLGSDPEGVHQLRVGVRRLRSGLGAFRGALPRAATEPLREELRWLARELGDARDLDVFRAELLEPVLAARGEHRGMKRLAEEVRALHEEAYGRARVALADPRVPALTSRLGRYAAAREWRDQPLRPESARLFSSARRHAREVLSRRHERLLRRGAALADATPSERHRARIALKKLRYEAEVFRSLFPEKRTARFLRRVARLQDRFGALNDLSVAEGILTTLVARMGAEATAAEHEAVGLVLGFGQARAAVIGRKLVPRFERLTRTRPFWV